MTVFEASGHNTAVSAPAGGSGVVCLQCHESHGSPNDYLMTYSGADSCLTCHRASGPFTGAKNIRELLTLSSSSEAHHDLSAADQAANGSFITCQNCHNTHTASAAFPLVDPDDPSPSGIWTGGANTVKETCFRCHDGQLPTAAQTLPWVKPPLGPGGTTQTADIQTAYATNPHGFGTGASFSLRPEMGYFNGDVLECDSCHEPHGAANNHNLRGDVSSADGVTTRRGLIVYDTPSGGNDVRFFCVSCHDTTQLDATRHPGGDIWSSFPVDCTTSCHKHVNGGL
jgi:predicted CXXCH cytochrome family protein